MDKAETIRLFKKFFIHRSDSYTVMSRNEYQGRDNYYDRVFSSITDQVLEDHLSGKQTVAVFPTEIETHTVKFCCWDIDTKDDIDLFKVLAVCERNSLRPVLEASGREKGVHVWTFFENPIPVKEARKFSLGCALRGIDFFPERSRVLNDFYFELPIKLPLGFHRKEKTWSRFITKERKEISIKEAFESAGYLI